MIARHVALLLALLPAPAQSTAPAFSFEQLKERARDLARHDYVPRPEDDLPEWLAKLDYDGYRHVRFRPEMSLWAGDGLPFRLQFMHRGYLFRRRVRISVVDGGEARELRFSPAQFEYAEGRPPVPEDLGYSGFAIRFAGGSPAGGAPTGGSLTGDEIASFQGASYFRLLGQQQIYGASARGLAVDTASPHGEEFPEFVEFWVEKPLPGAASLTLYGLLDSPSATGAYRFVITPGAETRAEVSACIEVRRGIEKLGVAPLTSMFLMGEDGLRRFPDYRPEVHDSDGLLAAAGNGDWVWRPLDNPLKAHRVTRLAMENPVGFGLLQRDRSFDHYEDLEARFDRRPSYWVAPHGAWGRGAVELVEIPSPAEWNDNVVAFWVPEARPEPGAELCLDYSVRAFLDDASLPPLARACSTRVSTGPDVQRFVLDFAGAPVDGDDAGLHADVSTTRGSIRNLLLVRNEPDGTRRCAFELVDDGSEPVELRVRLLRNQQQVSETLLLNWSKP